jgi:hypothetical protein
MEIFKKYLMASLGIICAIAIAGVVFIGIVYLVDIAF